MLETEKSWLDQANSCPRPPSSRCKLKLESSRHAQTAACRATRTVPRPIQARFFHFVFLFSVIITRGRKFSSNLRVRSLHSGPFRRHTWRSTCRTQQEKGRESGSRSRRHILCRPDSSTWGWKQSGPRKREGGGWGGVWESRTRAKGRPTGEPESNNMEGEPREAWKGRCFCFY